MNSLMGLLVVRNISNASKKVHQFVKILNFFENFGYLSCSFHTCTPKKRGNV